MTDQELFLKALQDDEDDIGTRMAYADWLEEHGEVEEADRQRKWPTAKAWILEFVCKHGGQYCEANYGTSRYNRVTEEVEDGDEVWRDVTYKDVINAGIAYAESDGNDYFTQIGSESLRNSFYYENDGSHVTPEDWWTNWSILTGHPGEAAEGGAGMTTLRDWLRDEANWPTKEMLWNESFRDQVIFVRDVLEPLFIERDEQRYELTTVVSTHRSKSITLPVYRIDLNGILLTMRDNFYSWNVSVEADRAITCDFLDCIDDSGNYTFCEGMEEWKYGRLSESKHKFTVALRNKYDLYVFCRVLRQFLGIKYRGGEA